MTKVFDIKGIKQQEVKLPSVFAIPTKLNLIHKAYIASTSNSYQPNGTDPIAGERTSAESRGTGSGSARIARVKGERHMTAGKGGGIASVVGGRISHPPKSEKNIRYRINKKERIFATASAISTTSKKELIIKRGHKVNKIEDFPIIITSQIEKIKKAKNFRDLLEKIGLEEELTRIKNGTKKRSGKSALRNRKKRVPKGPLVIIEKDDGIKKAVSSFDGMDCVSVKDLSIIDLAPGSVPGRLTIWSESALKSIQQNIIDLGNKYDRK